MPPRGRGFPAKAMFSFVFDPLREKSLRSLLEAAFLGALIIPALYSYFPIGLRLSLVNFTYGDKGLDPSVKATLPLHFLAIFTGTYAWEFFYRGIFLRGLKARWGTNTGIWGHLVLMNSVLIFLILFQKFNPSGLGILRFMILENLLQALWAFFYLRTGTLLGVAFFHSVSNFIRFVFLNDAQGPFETLYFYSAASQDFYWFVLAVTFLTLSLQIAWNRKWGLRL